jgi:hypothetical protein
MKSLADALPPEIAQKIHPDWRKNEAAYWSMRDQLLSQYQGQWIAFADGAVIAACKTSLEVLHTPGVVGRHPFVICVGREDEPYRIRRAAFAYDPTYPGQALPLLSAEFRSVSGSAGLLLDRVIPDTGADVCVLPWSDCQQLHLDPAVGVSASARPTTRPRGSRTRAPTTALSPAHAFLRTTHFPTSAPVGYNSPPK